MAPAPEPKTPAPEPKSPAPAPLRITDGDLQITYAFDKQEKKIKLVKVIGKVGFDPGSTTIPQQIKMTASFPLKDFAFKASTAPVLVGTGPLCSARGS